RTINVADLSEIQQDVFLIPASASLMESRKSARASPRLTRPLMSKMAASAVSRILIFKLIERIPFREPLPQTFPDGLPCGATAPGIIGSRPALRSYMRSGVRCRIRRWRESSEESSTGAMRLAPIAGLYALSGLRLPTGLLLAPGQPGLVLFGQL